MDDINAGLTLIKEVEDSRAYYMKLRGISQDATKAKDAAITRMKDWMMEFFTVAKIGLEDNPQLLEALGKVVKG